MEEGDVAVGLAGGPFQQACGGLDGAVEGGDDADAAACADGGFGERGVDFEDGHGEFALKGGGHFGRDRGTGDEDGPGVVAVDGGAGEIEQAGLGFGIAGLAEEAQDAVVEEVVDVEVGGLAGVELDEGGDGGVGGPTAGAGGGQAARAPPAGARPRLRPGGQSGIVADSGTDAVREERGK